MFDLLRQGRADQGEELLEALDRAFFANPEQPRAFLLDLVDQRQILVAFAILDLIHTDGEDRAQAAMRQTPFYYVLHRLAHLAMTVAKLRGARERKRRENGWCEGGSPLHIRFPEAVRLSKRLHRANPVTGLRRSLRKISAELAAAGHMMVRKYRGSEVPRPFNPATIKRMIEGPMPSSDGEDK